MPARGLAILVVDDQVNLAESLAALLRGDGHTVLTAYTALHAVELLQDSAIDCAIIDVILGSHGTMGGLDVARHGAPTLVRVAMTGYDAEFVERAAGERWPFDEVLQKPFDHADVRAVIAKVRAMLADTSP